MKKIRLAKFLSAAGVASRRNAEELIKQGKVKIDGQVVEDVATSVDADSPNIEVSGRPVSAEVKVYYLLNKPTGYICSVKDPYNPETVLSLVPKRPKVFPVGRLDKNSTGILLLTNDGDFANKIMHPSFEVTKTYEAQIDHSFNERDRRALERGILLDDGKTAPAKVKVLAPDLVSIKIHEGKNRIIRRMLKKLGYKTFYLHRAKIGKLGIGDLRPGKFRHLTPKDKEIIFVK